MLDNDMLSKSWRRLISGPQPEVLLPILRAMPQSHLLNLHALIELLGLVVLSSLFYCDLGAPLALDV